MLNYFVNFLFIFALSFYNIKICPWAKNVGRYFGRIVPMKHDHSNQTVVFNKWHLFNREKLAERLNNHPSFIASIELTLNKWVGTYQNNSHERNCNLYFPNIWKTPESVNGQRAFLIMTKITRKHLLAGALFWPFMWYKWKEGFQKVNPVSTAR